MRLSLFLALAVIALSGHADAQQRQRLQTPPNQSNQQQAAPDNRGTEQVPLVVKELPRERSTEEHKEAQEKSELDRKLTGYTADLATYTQWLFGASLLLAFLTGGLAVAAFFQMRDSRKSIAASERLANAAVQHAAHADRAIAVAEKSAERQLRAWVLIGPGIKPEIRERNIIIHFTIRNYGNTPAVLIAAAVGFGIIEDPALGMLEENLPGEESFSRGTIIPPRGFVGQTAELRDIEVVEWNRFSNREPTLYLWGTVRYRDATGTIERTTKYRLQMSSEYVGRMVYSKEGNDAA